ncbi:high affinity copper uptake protein 1 isoform X2 [Helicoverpa armigera]|nr:high affinity copper uptake protein 1-like [Helicoverpa zea]XP_047023574.1 high affinity copper uptake protein 1-like [Helicoverpa zea]XP_047023575.1 high affinity copper uptake protein 1-like [Helicoverpa zea]
MSGIWSLSSMSEVARHHAPDADDPCATHDHAMVFHSCVCAEILFKGWNTSNELQLFGSALVIFLAGVLYEAFKWWRESLPRAPEKGPASMWSRAHSVQAALHAVQATLSYLLMLVFMTYNVWLCLAVVLGLTLGYYLFGWRRAALDDLTEHCH